MKAGVRSKKVKRGKVVMKSKMRIKSEIKKLVIKKLGVKKFRIKLK